MREARDGRTNGVSCTAMALGLKKRIIEIANNTLNQIFSEFSAEEVKDFYLKLDKITNHAMIVRNRPLF